MRVRGFLAELKRRRVTRVAVVYASGAIGTGNSGNDLVFEIGDSGLGIPPDLVQKIFDRGFTTKQQDRGHGLYLVMTALKDLGGEITLTDSELGGALFTVFIPKQKGGNGIPCTDRR